MKNKKIAWYISFVSLVPAAMAVISYVSMRGRFSAPEIYLSLIVGIVLNVVGLIFNKGICRYFAYIFYLVSIWMFVYTEVFTVANVMANIDVHELGFLFYSTIWSSVATLVVAFVSIIFPFDKKPEVS